MAETTTPHNGTISVGLVRDALAVGRGRGIDVDAILDWAGISPDLLAFRQARVTATAYARLWEALADAMDDEFFGMDQHPMRRGSYRLMCQATLGASSLREALHRMFSFLRVVLDDGYGELHIQPDAAWIRVHDHGEARRMFTYATWIMLVHALACWLVRRRIPIIEARFRCPEPEHVEDYLTRFCSRATFGADRTEVRLDTSYLDLRVARSEVDLKAFLADAPANLLVRYRDEASTAARTRRILRANEPINWPELEPMAAMLEVSSATLQRRLQAEGSSYQKLKDDLRRDLAIEMLASTALTVAEIGSRSGFQETSAFHRAFKKWTGVSPGAYRHQRDRMPST